jgi:hypothetical protein
MLGAEEARRGCHAVGLTDGYELHCAGDGEQTSILSENRVSVMVTAAMKHQDQSNLGRESVRSA